MVFTDEVFPFRFAFDRNLIIREVGSSLVKLCRGFQVGAELRQLVVVNQLDGDVTFENLRSHLETPLDIQLASPKVSIRGQFVVNDHRITVVGSPQFSTLEEFEASGLGVADFAPHDTAIDYLFLRQSKAVKLEDHRATLLQLRVNEKEQLHSAFVEEALAVDLNAAGDMLLRLDADGKVVGARASRKELLPVATSELIGTSIYKSWPQLTTPLRDAINQLKSTSGPVPFSYQMVNDGRQIHCDARITSTLNGETLLLARDVTEQHRLERQLEHQATHDPLTDLPNRTLFAEQVQTALLANSLFAVLFIDLDGFKLINDRHGHHFGDKVLLHVSRSLRRCIREGDSAARLGGDEFAVLLAGISSKKAAEETAQRIIDELMKPVRVGHRSLSVSASVGIATTYDAKDRTTLFQFADIAMYRAKETHKCCFQVFEPSMYEDLLRRDTLQQQLLAAGTQGQFVNHYQPMVEVETGRIVALEALVRWQHPIRGLLMPSDFIQTAQESEAIVRLGEQTLLNACKDALIWDASGLPPAKIHFNVSSMQLRKSCLRSFVRQCLEESEFAPERVTAEIKEETMQHDFDVARREIDKLREVGVSVALDEFGAGNYSLAFLERLSLDSVKLARSFVHQLGQSNQKNQLVRAVVELAQAFGLEVIAVGVETNIHLELLQEFGCKVVQGEYYSRAITSSEIAALGSCVCANQLASV